MENFLIDPNIPEVPQHQENIYRFVATRKEISYEHSVRIHDQLARIAKVAGLEYHFHKMRVTNSLKAHRLIQIEEKGWEKKQKSACFMLTSRRA